MPAPPPPPPQHRPQTLKQAKAAYKARGQPSISEAQRKQLERAVELDRRAWRAKEAEKRKAEAAKKKAEREKEDRAQVQLATQRMCDKFGYKSSQMHLGAFLNKPGFVGMGEQKGNLGMAVPEESEDGDNFGDEDMDDETLLCAFNGMSEVSNKAPRPLEAQLKGTPPYVKVPTGLVESPMEPQITTDDFSCFFDDFGTSTQVARELDADGPVSEIATAQAMTLGASIKPDDYDDFDLTVEDLEELEPTLVDGKTAAEDRKLMPPPPLPRKRMELLDAGFTISELEEFVDDDLQLTQADPG